MPTTCKAFSVVSSDKRPRCLAMTLVFVCSFATGAQSSQKKASFAVTGNPFAAAAGDLDADGDPDVAVAGLTSDFVNVLRNESTDGCSAFFEDQVITVHDAPRSVAIGDVAGDGLADIVVAHNENGAALGRVSIFVNGSIPGQLSFSHFVTLAIPGPPTGVNQGATSVVLVDVDLDSDLDICVTEERGPSNDGLLHVFRRSSAGNFALANTIVVRPSPVSIASGHFNLDSVPDVVVACENGDAALLALGPLHLSAGAIEIRTDCEQTTLANDDHPAAVVTARFDDSNEIDDFCVNNIHSESLRVVLTDDFGALCVQACTELDPNDLNEGLAAANLDEDAGGAIDLVVPIRNGELNGFVGVVRASLPLKTVRVGVEPQGVLIADFDSDAHLDVLCCNMLSGSVTIILNPKQ